MDLAHRVLCCVRRLWLLHRDVGNANFLRPALFLFISFVYYSLIAIDTQAEITQHTVMNISMSVLFARGMTAASGSLLIRPKKERGRQESTTLLRRPLRNPAQTWELKTRYPCGISDIYYSNYADFILINGNIKYMYVIYTEVPKNCVVCVAESLQTA